MNFDIIATVPFERKLKRLSKKYSSIGKDLEPVIEQLSRNPTLGTNIGQDCYKILIVITSKGRGKSGGARIITFIRVVNHIVFLMDIYDKSEQANISKNDLKMLIDVLSAPDFNSDIKL